MKLTDDERTIMVLCLTLGYVKVSTTDAYKNVKELPGFDAFFDKMVKLRDAQHITVAPRPAGAAPIEFPRLSALTPSA